jgi:tetratricopeptide (TPR) repeat protein
MAMAWAAMPWPATGEEAPNVAEARAAHEVAQDLYETFVARVRDKGVNSLPGFPCEAPGGKAYADLTARAAEQISGGRYADAVARLRQAVAMMPDREPARLRLAGALLLVGGVEESGQLLDALATSKTPAMTDAAQDLRAEIRVEQALAAINREKFDASPEALALQLDIARAQSAGPRGQDWRSPGDAYPLAELGGLVVGAIEYPFGGQAGSDRAERDLNHIMGAPDLGSPAPPKRFIDFAGWEARGASDRMEALRAAPKLYLLAARYRRAHAWREAAAACRRALHELSSDWYVQAQLSDSLAACGEVKAARDALNEALRQAPNAPSLAIRGAELLAAEERWPEAAQAYEAAFELQSDFVQQRLAGATPRAFYPPSERFHLWDGCHAAADLLDAPGVDGRTAVLTCAMNAAAAELKSGRRDRAKEAYLFGLTMARTVSDKAFEYAFALTFHGDDQRRVAAQFCASLAQLLRLEGHTQAAVMWVNRALETDSGCSLAHDEEAALGPRAMAAVREAGDAFVHAGAGQH